MSLPVLHGLSIDFRRFLFNVGLDDSLKLKLVVFISYVCRHPFNQPYNLPLNITTSQPILPFFSLSNFQEDRYWPVQKKDFQWTGTRSIPILEHDVSAISSFNIKKKFISFSKCSVRFSISENCLINEQCLLITQFYYQNSCCLRNLFVPKTISICSTSSTRAIDIP